MSPSETNDYDSPWKEALEVYFPDFMAFFFPQADEDIDWSRGYEFLDQEFQQIVRDAELGKRLVDKLGTGHLKWQVSKAPQRKHLPNTHGS